MQCDVTALPRVPNDHLLRPWGLYSPPDGRQGAWQQHQALRQQLSLQLMLSPVWMRSMQQALGKTMKQVLLQLRRVLLIQLSNSQPVGVSVCFARHQKHVCVSLCLCLCKH